VWRPADGSAAATLVDGGVGLRVMLLAGPTIRVDYAWSGTDGNRTLYVGLGRTF
jgi:hypothetical protein